MGSGEWGMGGSEGIIGRVQTLPSDESDFYECWDSHKVAIELQPPG